MINEYVLVKFIHILMAIIALGTSAGLGIMLEFYGNHPAHGAFVLRAIRRLVGAALLALSLVVMHKQIRLFETLGPTSRSYRQTSLLERTLGGGVGIVVVAILYLMVTKPS